MTQAGELILELPMTCAALKRKVGAWKELFGSPPVILIEGDMWIASKRDVAFLTKRPVRGIARQYLEVKIDGEWRRVSPKAVALNSSRGAWIVLHR